MKTPDMDNGTLIPVELFCTTCHVETSLIDSLEESGLVQITVVQRRRFIAPEQMEQLEKMVRMHEDLGINVPGLEAIHHMLERIGSLQGELTQLRNRLRRFSDEG
jgi:hypothetical protein